MRVQTHKIIEFNCKIEHGDYNDAAEKLAFPDGSAPQEPAETIRRIMDACMKAFTPCGVYKVFNPALCTLPPAYREPAIKLVGTMMVFRGEAVYEKMRRAAHCVLLAATLAPPIVQDDVRKKLCRTPFDKRVFDVCCTILLEQALALLEDDIMHKAYSEGLHTDARLSPGEDDFPLAARSQIAFYLQAEKRLGLRVSKDQAMMPSHSALAIVGMYDKTHKNRKRACGRCKYRESCSIRAVGMNCHGRKGSFKNLT